MPQTPPALPAGRLVALDAFRGLIMFTLLCGGLFQTLKNHPSWNWLYEQNEHVDWQGCVYWDLIQPAFMFIVGVAMPIAASTRAAAGQTWILRFLHVLIRASKLILLGVILDNFGAKDWNFGFIRVLQQIAIGYVLAFLVVGRGFLVQGIAAAVILIGYNIFWVYSGYNSLAGPWAKDSFNVGKAFDLWMIGRNYSGNYVGLNAIPATATMIFGVMAGQLLISKRSPQRIALTLFLGGLIGVALGLAVSPWLPLIKRIWTPSFAVFSAGCVAILLAAFYWIIDVANWKRWAFPLVVVGMNSTAAYVMGGAFGGWFRSLMGTWLTELNRELAKWNYEIGPIWFPVVQRLLFAGFAWCILYWFYRRRIFFKL